MTMPRRKLGTLEVSVVGLGCNTFGRHLDQTASAAVVHAAIDAGINFFDTADVYGGTHSEELLGRALGARRSQVVVASKFGMAIDDEHKGAAPAYVLGALDDSLRRLGTDWIDLYQLHTPDPSVPVADTLGALAQAMAAGKVRQVGCSNFSAEQLTEAHDVGGPARFVSVQNQYSLLHRSAERDELGACERLGLSFIPYYPLARGLLTGKYRAGAPAPAGSRLASLAADDYERMAAPTMAAVSQLEELAVGHGRTVVELAVAWLVARPTVASVIAGTTSPAQVQANASAATWALGNDVLGAVDTIVAPGVDLL